MAEASDDQPFVYMGVCSDVGALGTYICTLELDNRPLRALSPAEALAYVTELMWAVTCAEYDAAVLAQLTAVKKLDMEHISWVMRGLREDRRPVQPAATYPVVYTPIVSARDHLPRVTAQCGQTKWQWETEVARQHCQQVLQTSAGVDMDAAYYKHLTGFLGLPEGTAREMVGGLREYLPGMVDTSQ